MQKRLGKRLLENLVRDEPAMIDAHMDWKFEYREIDYKVSHWGLGSMCDGHGMWNYYIYLREQQIGVDQFGRIWLRAQYKTLGGKRLHKTYDYYVAPLNQIEMHGGMTFYKPCGDKKQNNRYVEIGCDFGHLWDHERGYGYSLAEVRRDAEKCIESVHELFPALLTKCKWDGTFHPRDEMLTNKNGQPVWRGNKDAIPAEWNWFADSETAPTAA